MNFNKINLVITIASLSVVRVGCLRDVVVSIPHAVKEGDSATLNCSFQLDGDALYTVKWYKAGDEFFRFTPKETPPVKIFPTSGINSSIIEARKSDMNMVKLRRVVELMAGRYMCEVSADAPSFHTAFDHGIMTVVVAPEKSPILTGLQPRYKHGDKMSAKCISEGSKPAANITWYLNDKHVDKSHIKLYREVTGPRGDQEISISQVALTLKPSHFSHGRLKLKCVASIYSVYWETTEKSSELIGIRHKPDHPNQVYHLDAEQGHRRREFNRPAGQGYSRNLSSSCFSWTSLIILLSFIMILHHRLIV